MGRSNDSGRNRVALNVVTLIRLLQGRRYTPPLRELCEELGVCKKTLIRYLNAIEQAGWPLPKRGWHREAA